MGFTWESTERFLTVITTPLHHSLMKSGTFHLFSGYQRTWRKNRPLGETVDSTFTRFKWENQVQFSRNENKSMSPQPEQSGIWTNYPTNSATKLKRPTRFHEHLRPQNGHKVKWPPISDPLWLNSYAVQLQAQTHRLQRDRKSPGHFDGTRKPHHVLPYFYTNLNARVELHRFRIEFRELPRSLLDAHR